MSTSIAREEVQRLIRDEAAQLVEVLPSQEYQDEHIEGAINSHSSVLIGKLPAI